MNMRENRLRKEFNSEYVLVRSMMFYGHIVLEDVFTGLRRHYKGKKRLVHFLPGFKQKPSFGPDLQI